MQGILKEAESGKETETCMQRKARETDEKCLENNITTK